MPRRFPFKADRYCFECSRAFGRPAELYRHLNETIKHKGEKARCHPCHLCGRLFTQKSNIPEHIRSIHGFNALSPKSRKKKFRPTAAERRLINHAQKKKRKHKIPPLLNFPSASKSSHDSFLDIKPILNSTGEVIPLSPPTFRDIQWSDESHLMLKTDESALPYNFASSGSSSTSTTSPLALSTPMTTPPSLSTPPMNPFLSSSEDARECAEIEEIANAYFRSHKPLPVPPFPTPGSSGPFGAHGMQSSSFAPLAYNGFAGSFIPNQPGAHNNTQASSSAPHTNNQVIEQLLLVARERRDTMEHLYSRPQQQQHQFQHFQPQHYQQFQQQYDGGMGDQLSLDYLAPSSEIMPPFEQQFQLPQQFQWLPNIYDGFTTHFTNGGPY